MTGQDFASQVLSRHTFKISRKKESDFFDHRGTSTLSVDGKPPFSNSLGVLLTGLKLQALVFVE